MDTTQQCSKCYRHLDSTYFINKTGRILKSCSICREQSLIIYQSNLSNSNNHLDEKFHPDENFHSDEYLLLSEIKKTLYDEIIKYDSNEYLENDHKSIDFFCKLSLVEEENQLLEKTPHDISKIIAESIAHLKHNILHKRPERFGVSDIIKEKIKQYLQFTPKDIFRQLELDNQNLTQKQVHAWWANFIRKEYIRDKDNQLRSTKLLLEEYQYKIILINIEGEATYLGFITPFFDILSKNREIIVDATYNEVLQDITLITNNEIFNYNEDFNHSEDNNIFNEYEEWLSGALEIIHEQRSLGNYKWANAIRGSLEGVKNLYTDVTSHHNRITNPRTWKDHNKHTMFLD
ncbi:12259_t:CDS:2 [Cetraspora pellucida]|uniref:12259_t:CDS:1 n=1 Tax=Cetraspora pellucida TaxID=1433469 RepID=A0ACA9N3A8_9GLOM|nr:12259_t:CDS:2 [Cetraspora pellucida]